MYASKMKHAQMFVVKLERVCLQFLGLLFLLICEPKKQFRKLRFTDNASLMAGALGKLFSPQRNCSH